MKIFKSILMLLSMTVIALPIYAQDDGIGNFDINRVYDEATQSGPGGSSGGGLFADDEELPMREPENYALVLLRIVGYLVIVTALVFALAWGVRKFGIAGAPKVGGGNNMDIIESIYIGQNRGAALVRVGNIVYLLGHTPENIVMLEKIEGEKAVELIASSKGGASIMSFKDAFNNFLGKMKKT